MASTWIQNLPGVGRFFGGGGNADSPTVSAPGPSVTPEGKQAQAYQQRENTTNSQNREAKSRMQLSGEKMRVWENRFYSLIVERLKAQFHPENYIRMKLSVHTSTNLLTSIAREVSVLYEEPARRRLLPKKTTQTEGATVDEAGQGGALEDAIDDAEETAPRVNTNDEEVNALAEVLPPVEAKAEVETPFDRLMKASDWDTLLDTVEQLTVHQAVVWVRPVVTGPLTTDGLLNPETARLDYVIYVPRDADVIPDPDNPRRGKAWWYTADEIDVSTGKVRTVIWLCNETNWIKYDASWKELDRQPNKLQRMPVAVFRRRLPINKYFADGEGDDLFEGTIELCCLRTIQNARARDSGFKQLAVIGADPKDLPADMLMGGSPPIIIPEGSATVLDLQPELEQFTNLCRDRINSLMQKYGVHVDAEASGAPESGYAKKLRMAKILKESRRLRKHFAEAEKDLYHLVAVTLREYPVTAIGELDPEAELQTDFGEPRFDENPHEQAKTDALDLRMNKRSIIDVLRDSNPDLTDEELLELAHRNRSINNVFMTADQVRLTDVLASGAIVGGSLDKAPAAGQPPAKEE